MERSLQAIASRDGGVTPSLFLRLPAVMKLTGLGRSTIYRMVTDNRSPARFGLPAVRSCGGGRTLTAGASRVRSSRTEQHGQFQRVPERQNEDEPPPPALGREVVAVVVGDGSMRTRECRHGA